MRIYITRHGETEWNREGRMQGWENSRLTQKGIDNARLLGERLKSVDFSCIYCSPLGRTVETAENIRGTRDIRIVLKDSLKEIDFGLWGGMMHSEVKEMFPEQHQNFWEKPHLYKPVKGESYPEFIERVRVGLYDIMEHAEGENILIVTHAGVKKAIFSILKNIPLEKFWDPPFMYDTCLTVIEKKGKEINFLLEGDISHLD